jgi:hypothetical protein
MPEQVLVKEIIPCKKYHYSIPQSYSFTNAAISISPDFNNIIIYNQDHSKEKGMSLRTPGKQIEKIPLSDVSGFIYGSFSTRFWMMRIGIN